MEFIRKRTTFALLAVLVSAAALAGGCGGSDSSSSSGSGTTSAEEWADDLCGAISTWTTSIQSAVEPLKSGDVSKDSLQSATSDMKDATNTFVDDVKSLGKPDTDAGGKAKESLDTLADQLSQGVDDIKETADNVSGAAGAMAAIGSISTTVQQMGTDAQTALGDVEKADVKGELQDALKNAPACKGLQSAGS
jgi:methyl-accepting chemotaxis protein